MAFMIASLMASTLTEPAFGFGRRCDVAIIDGAGREGVAAVNPLAETPLTGDAGGEQQCLQNYTQKVHFG
jgi:hypothetical protein